MNHPLTLTAIVLITAIVAAGCCIDGNGDITTDTRSISSFHSLNIDIPGKVIIRKGDTRKVTVKTDDNLQDKIDADVKSNTLHLDEDSGRCIDPTELVVTVRMPELRNIDIDGSADVVIEDSFENETMKINIDGSGDVETEDVLIAETLKLIVDGSGDLDLDIDVAELATSVDGAGDIRLTGSALDHTVKSDGSGDIKAFDLETETADVTLSGSGDCNVTVFDELTVSISGSGDVAYKGEPDISEHTSGSGNLIDAN